MVKVSTSHQTKGPFPLKKHSSLFSQILPLIPRATFERLVRETQSARYAKGFSCWTHCVAMLFCQFAHSKSLREISDGLRLTHGKLNHLRIEAAPCNSTLAYANAHRPAELYERLFDDGLFHRWHQAGLFFVTRQKRHAAYEVVCDFTVPSRGHIRQDQLIRNTGAKAQRDCPVALRRIVVWDERQQREIVLLTNHLHFSATTIAAIYKDRWEIELFFKALKQHLKIKTFVGTSENALKLQIWTALISLLLLKYLQFTSQCGWPLCRLVAMLRLNLFTYRDLQGFLNDPFQTPPDEPTYQLTLGFETASTA